MKNLKDIFLKATLPVLFIVVGILLDRAFFLPTNLAPSPPTNLTASLEQIQPTAPFFSPTTMRGEEAIIIKIIDGDTAELKTGEKVRYIGIDTPESVAPNKPVECFAKEAYEKNKTLVEGKTVVLVKDASDKDRYGRLLRYVYVGDVFLNAELVQNGYAKAIAYPPDTRFAEIFTALEKEAKEKKLGLWKVCENKISVKNSTSSVTDCVIKGNISANGDKIYHLPNCPYYAKTAIDEKKGEKFFCSEEEAVSSGWRKALNCQ